MMRWKPVARPAIAAALAAILLLVMLLEQAEAHQLNVFAYVEGGEVVVEAKFSTGRVAQEGVVKVFDGADALIQEISLEEDGTARFPLGDHEAGLKVEVDVGNGHSNYWILTPQDIATQVGKIEPRP